MNVPAGAPRLPPHLEARLAAVRRRVRQIIRRRGLVAVLAVVLAAVLLVMAADALFPMLPDRLRAGLSLGIVLAAAWTAWRRLVRPLARPLPSAKIARALETLHPELQETLSSTVELMDATRPRDEDVSQRMIDEVARAADEAADRIAPRREFTHRTLRPWVAAGGVALAVLAACGLLWPRVTLRLLLRAVWPYANVGNLYAGRIAVEPGDARVPVGDALTITATTPDPDMKPVYLRTFRGGRMLQERMAEVVVMGTTSAQYAITLPAVDTSFAYQVRAGYALTDPFAITAEPRPDVRALSVTYAYPAYTGRGTQTVADSDGSLSALRGTRVTVEAAATKPLAAAEIWTGGSAAAGEAVPAASGLVWRWSFTLDTNTPTLWRLALRDRWGFENPLFDRTLEVLPDLPPEAAIIAPTDRVLRVRPTERIPLALAARDDFRVARSALLLRLDREAGELESEPEMAAVAAPRPAVAGQTLLDLAKLPLAGRRQVTVTLRALDNVPPEFGGAQTGESERLVLELDESAEGLARQLARRHEQAMRGQMDRLKEDLQKAEDAAKRAEEALTAKKPDTTRALAQAETAREATSRAEQQLHDLAEAAAGTTSEPLQPALQEMAKNDVVPARQAAEELPLAEAANQPQLAAQMKQDLQNALKGLEEIRNQFEAETARQEALARLEDLAGRETQLARDARSAERAQAGSPVAQPWQASQQQVAGAIGELAKALTADNGVLESLAQAAAEQAAAQAEAMQAAAEAQGAPEAAATQAAAEASPASESGAAPPSAAAKAPSPKSPSGQSPQPSQQAAQQAAKQSAQPASAEAAGQPAGSPEGAQSSPEGAAQNAAEQAQGQAQEQAQGQGQPPAQGQAQAQGQTPAQGQAQAQAEGQAQAQGQAQGQSQDQAAQAGQPAGMPEGAQGQPAQASAQSGSPAPGQSPSGPSGQTPPAGGQPAGQPAPAAEGNAPAAEGSAAGAEPAALTPEQAAAAVEKALQEAVQSSATAAAAAQAAPAADQAQGAADALYEAAALMARMLAGPGAMAPGTAVPTPGAMPPGMMPGRMMPGLPSPSAAAAGEPAGAMPGQPAPGQFVPGQHPGQMAQFILFSGETKGLIRLEGMSDIEWARIQGEARSRGGGAPDLRAPAEYRALVGRYFEEVSKAGGERK